MSEVFVQKLIRKLIKAKLDKYNLKWKDLENKVIRKELFSEIEYEIGSQEFTRH